MNRQFLSPPKVAELLGVGVAKIHYWIDAGEIEAVNLATEIGKRPRWGVSLESIDRFKTRRASIQPRQTPKRPRKPFESRRYF
ncbi:MAG: helix-turn-helix domain-containing protein [Pirellulales bacterium]